jgi:hypothetical protein
VQGEINGLGATQKRIFHLEEKMKDIDKGTTIT